jgi:hypothetical protein
VIYARDIVLPALIDSLKGTDREWETKEVEDVYAYIVSFSRKEDDFNMWRLYNAEVTLVVEKNDLSEAKIGTDEQENSNLPPPRISFGMSDSAVKFTVLLFLVSEFNHAVFLSRILTS